MTAPDELLRTLVERRLLPARYEAVLLVGSTARGWSNRGSDHDICVISTKPWSGPGSGHLTVPLSPDVVQTETFRMSDRRWEITYWLDAQVEQMLDKVQWAEFERDRPLGQPVLVPTEEWFLGRLVSCVPLTGERWLRERREQLQASAFRSMVVARSLGAADDCVEDALGQLDAGDIESAVLSARQALGHIVDALLEERGEYGNAPKWRPHRFRAVQPSLLSFDDYWAIETMRAFDPANPQKWVNDVVALCQDLSMKVET
jgi:predicted nucleotidyltransferase